MEKILKTRPGGMMQIMKDFKSENAPSKMISYWNFPSVK